jgi:hypothetical protein
LSRHVKGTLFVDYVRMIRGRKDVDWSRHLIPGDVEILEQRIEPNDWYPLDTFERMGLAILKEIAGGNMEAVHQWGRYYMDGLFQVHGTLIVKGDPLDSLMRFQVLRSSFFDFEAVTLEEVMGNEAKLRINYGMGRIAEEASAYQTAGFFERLLELAGAQDIEVDYTRRSWEEGPPTIVELSWK